MLTKTSYSVLQTHHEESEIYICISKRAGHAVITAEKETEGLTDTHRDGQTHSDKKVDLSHAQIYSIFDLQRCSKCSVSQHVIAMHARLKMQ